MDQAAWRSSARCSDQRAALSNIVRSTHVSLLFAAAFWRGFLVGKVSLQQVSSAAGFLQAARLCRRYIAFCRRRFLQTGLWLPEPFLGRRFFRGAFAASCCRFSIWGPADGVARFASRLSACANASEAHAACALPGRPRRGLIFSSTSSARSAASLPGIALGVKLRGSDLVADSPLPSPIPAGLWLSSTNLLKAADSLAHCVSSAASFIALLNSRAIPLALPTTLATFRNSTGRSFCPPRFSATTPTTNSY